jgi:chitinase
MSAGLDIVMPDDVAAPPPPPRTTRVSPLRVAILAVVTIGIVAGLVVLLRPVVSPPLPPGATGFAGYVDVTATPSYPFETPIGPSQRDVVLGFVVASPDDACTPSWGGFYTLDQAASDLELDRRIAQLRLIGGDARASFGGQANSELALACTDPAALAAAYQSVVDRYELTGMDFDLEGSALSDTDAMARRAAAVKQVQDRAVADGRSLPVWLTLPVDVNGLNEGGVTAVTTMLDAGVDVAGVNGMAMDFGAGRDRDRPMSDAVIAASTALQGQVRSLYGRAGTVLDTTEAWGRVGITPMIGQNDVAGEVFTIADAQTVNAFAREEGVGRLSMWSANRDGTCRRPLPTEVTVVQASCSGVDQEGVYFADVLGADAQVEPSAAASAPAVAAAAPSSGPEIVDDAATSPFPIWDPLGTYPAGTKVVWKRQVYQAKWWTSGMDPTTTVASEYDMPWLLLGPVLPGDTPAPLPTLPAGTYQDWESSKAYVAGARVQLDGVPYQAKWWTQGQRPGDSVAGGSPWLLVYPSGAQ